MKNEVIEKLFEKRFALCKEHGDTIGEMKGDIKTLLVRQSDWMDRVVLIEKRGLENTTDINTIKTRHGFIMGGIGLVATLFGALLDYLFRRS